MKDEIMLTTITLRNVRLASAALVLSVAATHCEAKDWLKAATGISTPKVPSVNLPKHPVHLPQPHINLPKIPQHVPSVPNLPRFDVPKTPKFETPRINVPTTHFPQPPVNLPKIPAQQANNVWNEIQKQAQKVANTPRHTMDASRIIPVQHLPQAAAQLIPQRELPRVPALPSIPKSVSNLPKVKLPNLPKLPNVAITAPSLPQLPNVAITAPSLPQLPNVTVHAPTLPKLPVIKLGGTGTTSRLLPVETNSGSSQTAPVVTNSNPIIINTNTVPSQTNRDPIVTSAPDSDIVIINNVEVTEVVQNTTVVENASNNGSYSDDGYATQEVAVAIEPVVEAAAVEQVVETPVSTAVEVAQAFTFHNTTEVSVTYSVRTSNSSWGTYTLEAGKKHEFEINHSAMEIRYAGNDESLSIPGNTPYAFFADNGAVALATVDKGE